MYSEAITAIAAIGGLAVLILIILGVTVVIAQSRASGGKAPEPLARATKGPPKPYQSPSVRLADYNDTIADHGFIALDTETTGVSEQQDVIVTFAAIHIHGDREMARIHLCFNPGRPSHPLARAIHGWRDRDLSIQPPIEVHVDQMVAFLSRSPVWVGHNIALDLGFLKRSSPALAKLVNAAKPVCTLELARETLPNMSNRKLDTCLIHYGLKRSGPYHNALEDVALTAQLAFHLLHLEPPSLVVGDGVPDNMVTPLPSGRQFPTVASEAETIEEAFNGLGLSGARNLIEAGFLTPEAVTAAPDDSLLAVKGIGPAKLAIIRSVRT